MSLVSWLLDKIMGQRHEVDVPALPPVDHTREEDYAGLDAWHRDQERRLAELRAALDVEAELIRGRK
jgi:hypothetical protein